MAVEKPKEEGAPAYMAQYTALMTILLAFFICMLTMGQQKEAEYKRAGYGQIRDAFSLKGGMGILPYMRAVMGSYPHLGEGPEIEEADSLGYRKGAFEARQLDADGITECNLAYQSRAVRLATPVMFPPGRWDLNRDARAFLHTMGRVFYNLPDTLLTVCCFQQDDGASGISSQLLAARRAATVVRYLESECDIGSERLRNLGYSHDRYLTTEDQDSTEAEAQKLVFLVQKKRSS